MTRRGTGLGMDRGPGTADADGGVIGRGLGTGTGDGVTGLGPGTGTGDGVTGRVPGASTDDAVTGRRPGTGLGQDEDFDVEEALALVRNSGSTGSTGGAASPGDVRNTGSPGNAENSASLEGTGSSGGAGCACGAGGAGNPGHAGSSGGAGRARSAGDTGRAGNPGCTGNPGRTGTPATPDPHPSAPPTNNHDDLWDSPFLEELGNGSPPAEGNGASVRPGATPTTTPTVRSGATPVPSTARPGTTSATPTTSPGATSATSNARPESTPTSPTPHHQATPWPQARALAARAGRSAAARRTPLSVPLDRALGLPLAAPLSALTDLPSFDTSAMDGWAVAGPGPWVVRKEGVLAGQGGVKRLGGWGSRGDRDRRADSVGHDRRAAQ